jgi:hydrogenase maturation protease
VSDAQIDNSAILVAGFGSSHGDDQVGWRVAERLEHRRHLRARVLKVREPCALLNELDGCQRLIIVDACRSMVKPGRITHLRWPNWRIAMHASHSTHGVAVCEVLRLAERLDRLPRDVEIFAVETSACFPHGEMTPAVLDAVIEVEARILAEIQESCHA